MANASTLAADSNLKKSDFFGFAEFDAAAAFQQPRRVVR
jgi:hypothetical protein